VLRPPTLTASMSASGDGEVRYRPPAIEVSGPGIATRRLDAAGDHLDATLPKQAVETESLATDWLGEVRGGSPLPVPAIPGLPSVGEPPNHPAGAASAGAGVPGGTAQRGGTEAGKVRAGTTVRIWLGDVRQATNGHAIAARASAITVAVTQVDAAQGRDKRGYAGKPRTGASIEADLGVLEAAAVAPEAAAHGSAGAGAGLPVTGPHAGILVAGGVGLVLAGAAAVAVGMMRRRTRS
jgi:hypothetical protein